MTFDLDIYIDDLTDTGQLVYSFLSVDVRWNTIADDDDCMTAVARDGTGEIVATLPAFGNDSVVIDEDKITIVGIRTSIPGWWVLKKPS